MPRKRDGFVPIGKVDVRLPGIEGRGRSMSAQTRHHFTTLRQVNQLIEAGEAEPDLGFMARLLALCSLPRTNPGDRLQYKRANGPYKLIMIAGGDNKLPYGNLPRLLLAWVCTEAVRTQRRELVLGRSLYEFMHKLGMENQSGGARGDRTRLKNQMRRLFTCSVQLVQRDGDHEVVVSSFVADRAEFWWSVREPTAPSLWLHTTGAEASAVAARSTNSASVSAIYEATPVLRFLGEASVASLSHEEPSATRARWDTSYIIGSRVRSARLTGELSLLRLGPGYLPLAYTSLGDRAGVFGSADYRLHRRVAVSGAVNRWHNNLRSWPARPTLDADNRQLGTRVEIGPRLFLNARVGHTSVATREAGPGMIDSRTRTVHADLSRQFGAWRLLGRATEIRFEEGNARRRSLRRRVDLEVRRTSRGGTGAWTAVGLIRERGGEDEQTGSGLAGRAGINWSARPTLTVDAEASWNQELAVLRALTVNNVALHTGLNWTLPHHGLTISLRGRYSHDTSTLGSTLGLPGDAPSGPAARTALGDFLLERSLDSYQFNVRVQKTLTWGRRPALGVLAGAARPRDFGHIEGLVFNDLNSDALQNAAESGVPGIGVRLDGQVVMQVDPAGRFAFRNVPVGPHTVELDLVSVPASFDVGPDWRVDVHVVRRSTTTSEFPLVQLGKLAGRVLLVHASSAAPERADAPTLPGPQPARGVLVVLNDGYKTTLTDADGEFEFTSLPAGRYRVRVGRSSLPEYWAIASEPARPVVLEPGGRVSDLELSVEARPRPSRRITITQPALDTPTPTPQLSLTVPLRPLLAEASLLAATDVLPFELLSIPDPTPTAEAAAPGLAVQVAAVRNATAAAELADRLVENGFPAYVAPRAADASDDLHRVRVGRSLARPAAEHLAARLSEEQQLDTYLVRVRVYVVRPIRTSEHVS